MDSNLKQLLFALGLAAAAGLFIFGTVSWGKRAEQASAAAYQVEIKATYETWCKYNNRNDLTLEEWDRLRRAGLLKK